MGCFGAELEEEIWRNDDQKIAMVKMTVLGLKGSLEGFVLVKRLLEPVW